MHAPLGYAWLNEQFNLQVVQPLPVYSSAGGTRKSRKGVQPAFQRLSGGARYPELTRHVTYLHDVVAQTLQQEMHREAGLLKANDDARQALKTLFEAPDMDLDVIIRSVMQNGYRLSNRLSARYPMLAEDPLLASRTVEVIREVFERR